MPKGKKVKGVEYSKCNETNQIFISIQSFQLEIIGNKQGNFQSIIENTHQFAFFASHNLSVYDHETEVFMTNFARQIYWNKVEYGQSMPM